MKTPLGNERRSKRVFAPVITLALSIAIATLQSGDVGAANRPGTVTHTSLQVSSESAGATETTYSFTFQAVHALVENVSTITVSAPAGTHFATADCYPDTTDVVTDDAARRGACGAPTVKALTITIKSPITTAPGDMVTVVLNGVTNTTSTGTKTMLVRTSSDPAPVRLGFVVRPRTAVKSATLQLSSLSAGAPLVSYSVVFQAPDRFVTSWDQKPTITLNAAPGTVFPQYTCGAYNVNDVTQQTGLGCDTAFQVSKSGSTVVMMAGSTTSPGDLIRVIIRGVKNTPRPGLHEFVLSTSADPAPVVLHYSLLPARAVTHPYLQLSSYARSAKATTWAVGFTSPDRLNWFSSPANSNITLVAPHGTVFPAAQSGCAYLFIDAVDDLHHCASAQVSDGGSQAVVTPVEPMSTPGATMDVVITGVTNPPGAGELRVWTSSDQVPVTLPLSHPTYPPPGLQVISSAAKATSATYVATFRLTSKFTSLNCLYGAAASRFWLSAPGTVFSGASRAFGPYEFYDLANGTANGATTCPLPGQAYTPGPVVPIADALAAGNFAPKPGDELAVVAPGATNASSVGRHALSVTTTTGTVRTGTAVTMHYVLTAATAPLSPLVQVSSSGAAASGVTYSLTFRTPDGFVASGSSSFSLSLPGITWGPGGGANDSWGLVDDTTGYGGGGYATYSGPKSDPNKGPATVTPTSSAGPGDVVTVTVDQVANPSAPGPHTLVLTTSADPVALRLPIHLERPVTVGQPVVNLSSHQGGATNATYALTFVTRSGLTPTWSQVITQFPGAVWPVGAGGGDGWSIFDDSVAIGGLSYVGLNGQPPNPNETGSGTASATSTYAAPGDVVTILATPIKLPSGAGVHTARVWTSADPVPASASVLLK